MDNAFCKEIIIARLLCTIGMIDDLERTINETGHWICLHEVESKVAIGDAAGLGRGA